MTFANKMRVAVAALMISTAPFAAVAGGIMADDAYARTSTPSSKSGAAFLMLMNHGDTDDRLIGASSDVSKRVELHTHTEDANGVMKMGEIEGGVPLPAGATHMFKRGGDHLMFMGLNRALEQGEVIDVILEFEQAGEVPIKVTVDHERKPDHGAMKHGDHSGHSN